MNLLKSFFSIFSNPKKDTPDTKNSCEEEYEGFMILATPAQEGSQFRINGLIRKGERQHLFIRADILPTAKLCSEETLRKAKLMIDQQGDNIFH